jgi:hypothetical protein
MVRVKDLIFQMVNTLLQSNLCQSISVYLFQLFLYTFPLSLTFSICTILPIITQTPWSYLLSLTTINSYPG